MSLQDRAIEAAKDALKREADQKSKRDEDSAQMQEKQAKNALIKGGFVDAGIEPQMIKITPSLHPDREGDLSRPQIELDGLTFRISPHYTDGLEVRRQCQTCPNVIWYAASTLAQMGKSFLREPQCWECELNAAKQTEPEPPAAEPDPPAALPTLHQTMSSITGLDPDGQAICFAILYAGIIIANRFEAEIRRIEGAITNAAHNIGHELNH